MRVALLAMGSRGDVEPFLALAGGLADAGHEATVVVPRDLTHLATDPRMTVRTFPVDVVQASHEGIARDWQAGASRGVGLEYRLLREVGRQVAGPIAEGVLASSGDADLVVSGGMTYDAASAATSAREQRHVLALMAPTTPARSGASTTHTPRPDRTSPLNNLAAVATAVGAYRIFRPAGELVRERLGLARGNLRTYLRTAYRTPALLAASPAVVPPAPEWAGRMVVTGWWHRPAPVGWEPPEDLAVFLAAGPPPVYVGFGSMMSRDPVATTEVVLEALRRTGLRGLVSSGWTGLHSEELPDGVRLVGDVPHDWLFPRTAGVVHHGGAGTTGSAVRAGVPQVVVPHVADQPYWGRRVDQLGIGSAPIRRHELDADRLAEALARVTGDEAVLTRAADLGAVVRAEDGVARAVELLQGLSPRR